MSAYSFTFAGATVQCGRRWTKPARVGPGMGALPMLRRSGNIDVESSVALLAMCVFDPDGSLTRMCPTLIVALAAGVGASVFDPLLARAGMHRTHAPRHRGATTPCTSVFHSSMTEPSFTVGSRANHMCKPCFRFTLCAEQAAWPLVRQMESRVGEPLSSALRALAVPGCRATIVAAAAGDHDLCYSLVLKTLPADAWRALPCAETLHRILRSKLKDDILSAIPTLVDIGWVPLKSTRATFGGPDVYFCQNTLVLGSVIATCRLTLTIHTAGCVGTGPVDKMSWAELAHAAKCGTIYGVLDGASPPFRLLVASAAHFANVTLHGPSDHTAIPLALMELVNGPTRTY